MFLSLEEFSVNLQKYVICSLTAASLSFTFGNTTAYMAALPSNMTQTVNSQTKLEVNQQPYSLDFDATKNYTEETMM